MPHIRVIELGQHWFRQWLVLCPAPSHYPNQCWLIVNWKPGNKHQWNLNRNFIIFIQENTFEIVVGQNGGHFVHGGWGKNFSAMATLLRLWYHIIRPWTISVYILSSQESLAISVGYWSFPTPTLSPPIYTCIYIYIYIYVCVCVCMCVYVCVCVRVCV